MAKLKVILSHIAMELVTIPFILLYIAFEICFEIKDFIYCSIIDLKGDLKNAKK